MLFYTTARAKICFIEGPKGLQKDAACNCLKTNTCATVPDPLKGTKNLHLDPALINTIKQSKIAADAAMRGDKKTVDKAVAKITTKDNIKKVEKLFRDAKKQYNARRVAKGLPPVDFTAKEKALMKSLRTQVGKDVAKGNYYGYKGKLLGPGNYKKKKSADFKRNKNGDNVATSTGDFNKKQAINKEMVINYKYKIMDISDKSVPLFKVISARYMKAMFPLTLEEMKRETKVKK
jgi:hypothetical protein